jgi:hypothetical protein
MMSLKRDEVGVQILSQVKMEIKKVVRWRYTCALGNASGQTRGRRGTGVAFQVVAVYVTCSDPLSDWYDPSAWTCLQIGQKPVVIYMHCLVNISSTTPPVPAQRPYNGAIIELDDASVILLSW